MLQQEQSGYEFCQKQMAECGRKLAQCLAQLEDRSEGATLPQETRKNRLQKKKGNKPQFDLRAELFRMSGTDLTQIDGVEIASARASQSPAASSGSNQPPGMASSKERSPPV